MRDPEKIQSETWPGKRPWHVAGLMAVWIAKSCAITLHNKYILSTLEFDFPYLLTCWHLTFATCITRMFVLPEASPSGRMTWQTWFSGMLPLAILSCASLILGNKAYLYLSVSSIQMLKATSPAAASLAAYLFALSVPNVRDTIRIAIIVLGGFIISYGDLFLTSVGLSIQLGAIAANALRTTLSQVLLQSLQMDPLHFLYHSAPIGAVIAAGCAAFFEFPRLRTEDLERIGIFQACFNGSLALGVTMATSHLIKETSALALSLSSLLRDVLLVCGSSIIFKNTLGFWHLVGYSLVVMCLVDYSLTYRRRLRTARDDSEGQIAVQSEK